MTILAVNSKMVDPRRLSSCKSPLVFLERWMLHFALLGLIPVDIQSIPAPLLFVVCMVYPVLDFVDVNTQKRRSNNCKK